MSPVYTFSREGGQGEFIVTHIKKILERNLVMKRMISFIEILTLFIVLIIGCSDNQQIENDDAKTGVEILQAWQGDYPVNQFHLLPEGQRDSGVGYIGDDKSFARIWQQFKPNQTIPDIDFQDNLVLFARNVQFYNRISIGQVKLTDGVAEILAMETMSALPIENNVALSMVAVTRAGIKEIKIGEEIITID
jgi:hypothetical protein